MSIIEQIRAEVDRLYDGEAPAHDQQCDFADGYFTGISAISQVLDTLQEQPVKDFPTTDEEMQHFLATHKPVQVPDKYKTVDWVFDEKQSDTRLEQASLTFEQNHKPKIYYEDGIPVQERVTLAYAFKEGAKWCYNNLLNNETDHFKNQR